MTTRKSDVKVKLRITDTLVRLGLMNDSDSPRQMLSLINMTEEIHEAMAKHQQMLDNSYVQAILKKQQ